MNQEKEMIAGVARLRYSLATHQDEHHEQDCNRSGTTGAETEGSRGERVSQTGTELDPGNHDLLPTGGTARRIALRCRDSDPDNAADL